MDHNDACAFGYSARVGGQYGIAFGWDSRVDNTGGVAIGASAYVDGNNSVAIARECSVTVSNSVVIGYLASIAATSSVAIGYDADVASTASQSIAIGQTATTDSIGAVAVGYAATGAGQYGVAMGWTSTVGGDNGVAIGPNTNASADGAIAMGSAAAASAASGVAIGVSAAASGENSTAVGASATATGENATAVGYQASATSDNTVYIGNSAVASIGGIVNWTAASDGRLKSNVQENVPGLDFINGLRPVTYTMNTELIPQLRGQAIPADLAAAYADKAQTTYTGFIAQEVEATAPNTDYDFSGVKTPQNEDDIYGLRYAEFVVPLTKAVQELDEQHQSNEAIIQKNKTKLAHYEHTIAELKAKVEALKSQKEATANNHSEQSISTVSQPK